MKHTTLKQGTTPPILYNLFIQYQTLDLDENSVYDNYVDAARLFLEQGNSDVLEDVDAIRLDLGPEYFNFPKKYTEEQQFTFILSFENYCKAVYNVFFGYQPRFLDFQGFERLASPPLKAYNYVGHNELDIKPSKSSYSSVLSRG
jgi:hypothetical protein